MFSAPSVNRPVQNLHGRCCKVSEIILGNRSNYTIGPVINWANAIVIGVTRAVLQGKLARRCRAIIIAKVLVLPGIAQVVVVGINCINGQADTVNFREAAG